MAVHGSRPNLPPPGRIRQDCCLQGESSESGDDGREEWAGRSGLPPAPLRSAAGGASGTLRQSGSRFVDRVGRG